MRLGDAVQLDYSCLRPEERLGFDLALGGHARLTGGRRAPTLAAMQARLPSSPRPLRGFGRRTTAIAFVALLAWPKAAAAAPPGEPGPDRYRLEARLEPASFRVDGVASIDWCNRSPRPLASLPLHLYANAFADRRSVFMREHGDRFRGRSLQRTGGIELTSVRFRDGQALALGPVPGAVAGDRTQIEIALPRPLAPGACVALEIAFRTRLPSIVARMGEAGDFFMVAQWFPKLARLEADGSFTRFPYHALGEFYADFADYELELRVPDRYAVAAPGARLWRRAHPDGTYSEHYLLGRAVDVAFAAYPRFCTAAARAVHARIEVFAPRGHLGLAREQAELLATGLDRLERWLGPYPYRRLVAVLPPAAAEAAAGMEYPGLIAGWTAAFDTEINPVARATHALVSSHELAHQWFPMLAQSNELSRPMLDEGLAEWLGLELLRARYGRAFFVRVFGLPLDAFELARVSLARSPSVPSSLLPAYAYRPGQLAAAVYQRPALVLESVRRRFGAPRLERALADYALRQRYAHPRLEELWASFDRHYYPGFSEHVLKPALEGGRFDALAGVDPERRDLVDAIQPGPSGAERGVLGQPLLARFLFWLEAALVWVGP